MSRKDFVEQLREEANAKIVPYSVHNIIRHPAIIVQYERGVAGNQERDIAMDLAQVLPQIERRHVGERLEELWLTLLSGPSGESGSARWGTGDAKAASTSARDRGPNVEYEWRLHPSRSRGPLGGSLGKEVNAVGPAEHSMPAMIATVPGDSTARAAIGRCS
ncbi:hypothetical protein M407DRAFT_224562 [Tulasnella calospora MUT 4182]|uniref:Uncharacterized protein n=1 Tax=Tulasnella calospora MUT 4182 TaxID=1051891 RepID=A0A0C3KBR3_9AGAM|nr:hypothetical protein M407DRAFT_224562 [Tulasnella calospora MUT 4182]